ncbi:MAG: cell division protein FtsZ [Pseudomonadota bacterium]
MSITIGPAATDDLRPRITVIGIGGAGGNAIANMIASDIEGVDFIVANTDAQALSSSPAEKRIQLGPDITGGLGAGARPEVGKAAAEETVQQLEEALEGVNMVFIAAGMGGGTGTGAAPVIAETARKMGILTVGVVTKPFLFEGTRRMRAAESGITELQDHVDTLIVIPNQNLFLVAKAETTFKEAFELADEVLQQGVRSITDLMVMPGLINLDFADVRSVMSEMGKAMMGTGEGQGENRALEAAEQAIANPLLDGVSMQGARGVIISIIGGEDMKLLEVDEAANHIRELVDEDANIIWGSAFNPDLDGKIRVSVVATGIEPGAAGMTERPAVDALSSPRAPKRPVLDLPSETQVDEAQTERETASVTPLSFAGASSGEVEEDSIVEASEESEPFDLTGMQTDDDMGDLEDDVDEIVDPLAGLRGADDDDFELGASEEEELAPRENTSLLEAGSDDEDDETLELSDNYAEFSDADEGGDTDDVLADADRLAEEDNPVEPQAGGSRRRGLLGGGSGDGAGQANADGGSARGGATGSDGGSSGGSTLFERMANLSRSSGKDDDEDDEDDGDAPALSIPRFLGRQNNQ